MATSDSERKIAEAVRAACLATARDAYEDALRSGLCAEGALEVALGAIETLDIDSLSLSPQDRK